VLYCKSSETYPGLCLNHLQEISIAGFQHRLYTTISLCGLSLNYLSQIPQTCCCIVDIIPQKIVLACALIASKRFQSWPGFRYRLYSCGLCLNCLDSCQQIIVFTKNLLQLLSIDPNRWVSGIQLSLYSPISCCGCLNCLLIYLKCGGPVYRENFTIRFHYLHVSNLLAVKILILHCALWFVFELPEKDISNVVVQRW
jgi:hypothetical protein